VIKQLVPNAAGHNIQALATSSTEYHLPALSTSVFEDVNMSLSYLWRERERETRDREKGNAATAYIFLFLLPILCKIVCIIAKRHLVIRTSMALRTC